MSIWRLPDLGGFDHLPEADRPHVVAEELLDLIKWAIDHHPRSLQSIIGPSEIGQPCTRRLIHKLAGHTEPETRIPWKPTVGTAVHAWIENEVISKQTDIVIGELAEMSPTLTAEQLQQLANLRNADNPRFLAERRVTVGQINGVDITGSTDVFDTETLGTWDWKVVGPRRLSHYKRHGWGQLYQTQAHAYGQGWRNAGYDVRYVGAIFLPRDGELRDTHVWYEPFDPWVAAIALERCTMLCKEIETFGVDVALTLHPDLCDDPWCPWCPRQARAAQPPPSIEQLLEQRK